MPQIQVFHIIIECVMQDISVILVVRKAVSTGEILVDLVTTSRGSRTARLKPTDFLGMHYAGELHHLIDGKLGWNSSYNQRQPCRCGKR